MTEQEKIELVAEALEMEANELSLDTRLEDLAEYDSMAKLSIIVLMDEEFEKKLTGETMAKFETVGDIISFASE
jgi:acyl carrier protein